MAAKPPDMGEMMGALGGMPKAADEPAAPPAEPKGTGEVSDEEMTYAKDMGFDAGKAAALKRFIRSCMNSEESGEYQDEEPPASAKAEQGAM